MEKISSDKVAAVLSTVPGMLRGLASERDNLRQENDELKEKVAEYERRERIVKLARTAEEKGISSWGETEEEKVASIENAVMKGGKLEVMEEAVKLSSPNGDLASLSGDELEPGTGSQLENYLLGHLG